MQSPNNLDALTPDELRELVACLEVLNRESQRNRIRLYYPDEGPLRRELYPKHMEFFRAGAKYRERCFMAANRIGKTEGAGGYEVTLHLTGQYPHWWDGRRFDMPTDGWACGKTTQTVRDILQAKLFGKVEYEGDVKRVDGTGLIPYECIGRIVWSRTPDLIDTAMVKHVTGEWSKIGFKTYEQGRGAFEGTEKDWIWHDEEPPWDVYEECLIRTATTDGLMLSTFTPLEGATEVVNSFLPSKMLNELMQAVNRA